MGNGAFTYNRATNPLGNWLIPCQIILIKKKEAKPNIDEMGRREECRFQSQSFWFGEDLAIADVEEDECHFKFTFLTSLSLSVKKTLHVQLVNN
ncbi:hypothetical protein I3843_08G105000 [Carya illinoinensis]|nr:hypothetical protein I3843_08G105000 [Carya illinoinensis]